MHRTRPDGTELIERELTRAIIGGFFECYNALGYGFLESVYRRALSSELRERGLTVTEEAPVEVNYKGLPVGVFKIDLLVEHRVIVEAKATSSLGPADKRQLINYLRATNLEVELLLHFGPDARFQRCINAQRLRPLNTRSRSAHPDLSASSG